VAHPDDETIFFGGLLQVYRRRPWKLICVTDGNADGMGHQRHRDFLEACKTLRVQSVEQWDFPDLFESRLDVERLMERLSHENAVEVFTHGILGEYGHPHHQDVSLAVHRSFQKRAIVWSVAYNCFADKNFRLPRKPFAKKCEILARTYFSQTKKFARWLPATPVEGFSQMDLKEAEALYSFLIDDRLPDPGDLKIYSWFFPYLPEFRRQMLQRPF
jgi:LmbE family N-acetylglucosaminyl deacetylase